MAANKDLKTKIRTYYETHFEEIQDVAKKFDIPLRTLYRWIRQEGWEQGIAKMQEAEVIDNLVKPALASHMDYAKIKTKQALKENFLKRQVIFDEELIDTTTDDILLEAMSIKFIDKTLIETALSSKQALDKIHEYTHDSKNLKLELSKIQAAKDVCMIFDQVKKSIHGKDAPNVSVQIANITQNANVAELANMSNEELNNLLLAQG